METADRTRTAGARLEPQRLLGTAPSAAFAPAGSSGERVFFAERLALFARIACLASSGFLVMRIVLNAAGGAEHPGRAARSIPGVSPGRDADPPAPSGSWPAAAPSSDRGLRRLDAAGTIAAAFAYALMESTMPLPWRPDQLVLLILNAVLLGRAALVPSDPRRTAWISAVAVAPIPFVTFFLFRGASFGDLLPGRRRHASDALGDLHRPARDAHLERDLPPSPLDSPRAAARANTRSSRRSAKAGWASSTAPSTRCCGARRRSSCSPRRAPARRICGASSGRRS